MNQETKLKPKIKKIEKDVFELQKNIFNRKSIMIMMTLNT